MAKEDNFNEAQELISKNNELKNSLVKVQNAQLKTDGYIFNVSTLYTLFYYKKTNRLMMQLNSLAEPIIAPFLLEL